MATTSKSRRQVVLAALATARRALPAYSHRISPKKFKPHPDTYRLVLNDLGVKPEEVLMVAAHAWDLAGAKNVGLRTAFIARPGKTLYPNAARPDYVVGELSELVNALREAASPPERRPECRVQSP